jgi:hypothetical protein
VESLILLIGVGLAVVGLLLAVFPRVGAILFSLDPRGFSEDQLTRRTRWIAIAMVLFAILMIVLTFVKPAV